MKVKINDFIESKDSKLIGYVVKKDETYVYVRPIFNSFYYNIFIAFKTPIGLEYKNIKYVNNKEYNS